jgi:hypothetical protein
MLRYPGVDWTINGHPAYKAQFHWNRNLTNLTTLAYFMVTDDYTGYDNTRRRGT